MTDRDGSTNEHVALDALAPRQTWIDQLPALGRAAAAARHAPAAWSTGVPGVGRWFVPLAAGLAAACWIAAARLAPPPREHASWLVTGSDHDLVVDMMIGAAP